VIAVILAGGCASSKNGTQLPRKVQANGAVTRLVSNAHPQLPSEGKGRRYRAPEDETYA
jgi:hypothetical protein